MKNKKLNKPLISSTTDPIILYTEILKILREK